MSDNTAQHSAFAIMRWFFTTAYTNISWPVNSEYYRRILMIYDVWFYFTYNNAKHLPLKSFVLDIRAWSVKNVFLVTP